MAMCPVHTGVQVTGPCSNAECYNCVPTLDFNCLALHGAIYSRSPADILYSLYGKAYKMTVALAIKASRISYSLRSLEQKPVREMSPFEGTWCSRVNNAGPLDSRMSWVDLLKANANVKFADRMLQVLNTMEVNEYSLAEVLRSYKNQFGRIDYAAFALTEDHADAVEQLLRSLR